MPAAFFLCLVPLAVAPPVHAVAPLRTQPRKGALELAEAVRSADVIVIGHVERVIELAPSSPPRSDSALGQARERPSIAEVVVERVIKGEEGARHVVFLASRTWACDASRAVIGERALFLLSEAPELDVELASYRPRDAGSPEATPLASWAPDFTAPDFSASPRRERATRIHRLVGSGDGRLPIGSTDVPGSLGTRATISASTFALPDELEAAQLPDPALGRHRQLLLLDDLVAWIDTAARRQSPSLVVEDRGRGAREIAWRVEIWADGEARVRSGSRPSQRFALEPSAAKELSSMLEHAELATLPRVLGWPGTDEAPITIERRDLRSRTGVRLEGLHHSRRAPLTPELRRALSLYLATRALLDAEPARIANAADARAMCLDLLARRP